MERAEPETLAEKVARVKEQYPDETARTKAMMEWRMDDADFQRVFQGIRRNPRLPQEYTKGMATACLYAIEWAVNHGMLVPAALAQQAQPEACVDHTLRIQRLVEANTLLKQAQPLTDEMIEAEYLRKLPIGEHACWMIAARWARDRMAQQAQPVCKCGEPLPHSDLVIFANHPEAFGTTPVPLDSQ